MVGIILMSHLTRSISAEDLPETEDELDNGDLFHSLLDMFFSCLLRIVDSFGTEPAYNLRAYAKSHKILTSWGGQDLLPQQFFTMFRKKKILYKNTHLISVIFQSNDWIR